jgi:hypothetical protein
VLQELLIASAAGLCSTVILYPGSLIELQNYKQCPGSVTGCNLDKQLEWFPGMCKGIIMVPEFGYLLFLFIILLILIYDLWIVI